MNQAQRIVLLNKNYIEAVEDGKNLGYKIVPIEHNNLEKYYILLTPITGLYKNQRYVLEMHTTYGTGEKYIFPDNPPKMQFLTKIYHVNIATTGTICLDVFKEYDKWSPMNKFNSVIQSIILLLQFPNPSSPFNVEASRVWAACNEGYKNVNNSSCNDEDTVIASCFKTYIDVAKKIESENDLARFAQWFPELSPHKNVEHEALLLEQLEEQKAMYQFNIAKQAKKETEKKKPDASKPPRWARHQK
jgi:ubiquitin-protein ligase